MASESRDGGDELEVALVSLGLQGGIAQYTAVLANELAELASVTVVTPESAENRSIYADDVELRTVDVADDTAGVVASFVSNLWAFLLVQWHLRTIDADVVHVPFVAGVPSAVATILICLHRSPVVGTIHDPKSHTGQEVDVLGRDLRETLVGATARFLDAVVVHGDVCRRQAMELGYPMEKVHVVPHGLYSHFGEAGQSDVEPEPNTLLFFGMIRPNKGFDRIPELLDRVAEAVPDVRAIVAGSPDVAPQIDDDVVERTVAALESHDRVELHAEYVPNDEVATYFERASVVVLPYYDATFSGVAMIAYTFGTPVVATRTGEIEGLIEADETGLLADPDSTVELADRVVEVLTDDDRREELRRNVEAVREDHRWDRIARQTRTLYRRCRGEQSTDRDDRPPDADRPSDSQRG